MDKKFLEFGERVEGYDIPVINEREARGAAGILLVMALFSFFYAYAFRDFCLSLFNRFFYSGSDSSSIFSLVNLGTFFCLFVKA